MSMGQRFAFLLVERRGHPAVEIDFLAESVALLVESAVLLAESVALLVESAVLLAESVALLIESSVLVVESGDHHARQRDDEGRGRVVHGKEDAIARGKVAIHAESESIHKGERLVHTQAPLPHGEEGADAVE